MYIRFNQDSQSIEFDIIVDSVLGLVSMLNIHVAIFSCNLTHMTQGRG